MNLLIRESSYYWTQPGITAAASDSTTNEVAAGLLVAFIFFFMIIIALVVVCMIAKYKLFKKMGMDGYKGLIPMVETYLTMEKIDVSPKWLLVICFGSFVCLVPCIGYLVFMLAALYFSIIYSVSLARSFGRSDGFGVGLLLLGPIFLMILAFGDSKYIGPKPMEDKVFGNDIKKGKDK